jgi:hypothetical protein
MSQPTPRGSNPKGLPSGGMPSNRIKKPPLVKPFMPTIRNKSGVPNGPTVGIVYKTY